MCLTERINAMRENELTDFILQIAEPLMKPAIALCAVGCAFWIIVYLIRVGIYKRSAYYRATGNSYRSVMGDTGRYGEYLTGKELAGLGGRVFYNVYIPKREGTTEADIVMVHPSGVYVIESKNYSGRIYGGVEQPYWTQVLPRGKGRRAEKERFFNPIMQNDLHVKYLKRYLGGDIPVYSYIVFSERCDLDRLMIDDDTVRLMKRSSLAREIKRNISREGARLDEETLGKIAEKLGACKADAAVREEHIREIRDRHGRWR